MLLLALSLRGIGLAFLMLAGPYLDNSKRTDMDGQPIYTDRQMAVIAYCIGLIPFMMECYFAGLCFYLAAIMPYRVIMYVLDKLEKQ